MPVNRSAKTDRDADEARQPLDRPRFARRAVQRGERASDQRIAQAGEPAGLRRRQRFEILTDGLDEHQL
jgi:hypothetical protein